MNFELVYSEGNKIECTNMINLIEKLTYEKSKIDEFPTKWDKVKKNINIYEYIYTSQNINKNISNIIPISRSYFKLIEMVKEYKLIDKSDIRVFCMAEAPGGFIQSLLNNKNIKEIGATTLISENKEVPHWNRIILSSPLVKLYHGINEDGDLCNIANLLSIIKKFGKNSIDLITGDGGFDYSEDYNKQEQNSLPLIYSEIFLALNLQKEGGNFICKFFDIFFKNTIQLLYLLSKCYRKIFIHKPSVSRASNSEKYIVCLDFKGYNKEIVNLLFHYFKDNNLDIQIDSNFEKELIKINQLYIDHQIFQINKGIQLIKSRKISNRPSHFQIRSAIEWCEKYNVPMNKTCYYLHRTFPH